MTEGGDPLLEVAVFFHLDFPCSASRPSGRKAKDKMPKEKSINPAQAQRKADKAKAIKKGMLFTQPMPST